MTDTPTPHTCFRCRAPVERPGANEVRYGLSGAKTKVIDYCDRCAPLIPALQGETR